MFWPFRRTPKGWTQPSAKWKKVHDKIFIGDPMRHIQIGYLTKRLKLGITGLEIQVRRDGVVIKERAAYMHAQVGESHVLSFYDQPPRNQCHEYTLWIRAIPRSRPVLFRLSTFEISTLEKTDLTIKSQED